MRVLDASPYGRAGQKEKTQGKREQVVSKCVHGHDCCNQTHTGLLSFPFGTLPTLHTAWSWGPHASLFLPRQQYLLIGQSQLPRMRYPSSLGLGVRMVCLPAHLQARMQPPWEEMQSTSILAFLSFLSNLNESHCGVGLVGSLSTTVHTTATDYPLNVPILTNHF